MDMNQVTLGATSMEESIAFYELLGLRLIVKSLPHYARFELPSGNATFSLHEVEENIPGSSMIYFEVADVDKTAAELKDKGIAFDTDPTDERWMWREARLKDPAGNPLCIYHAGDNRRYPPWRIQQCKDTREYCPAAT